MSWSPAAASNCSWSGAAPAPVRVAGNMRIQGCRCVVRNPCSRLAAERAFVESKVGPARRGAMKRKKIHVVLGHRYVVRRSGPHPCPCIFGRAGRCSLPAPTADAGRARQPSCASRRSVRTAAASAGDLASKVLSLAFHLLALRCASRPGFLLRRAWSGYRCQGEPTPDHRGLPCSAHGCWLGRVGVHSLLQRGPQEVPRARDCLLPRRCQS